MPNDSSRNTIVFIVCALVILVLYQMFVLEPRTKQQQAEAQRLAAASAPAKAGPAGARPGVSVGGVFVSRAQAAAASPRVRIDTPALQGSVALKGARIDDLYLKRYHQSADKTSPMVELFRPEGAEHAYFAEFGWAGANVPGLPTPATVWTAEPGATLTPQTPLTLTYDNGQGLVFKRVIAVDPDYMFTLTDTVTNAGAAPVSLSSYGSVQQQGLPTDLSKSGIIHEGGIGALSGEGGKSNLKLAKYKSWKKDGVIVQDSTGGWLGITEKYWLAALIPAQDLPVKAEFRVVPSNNIDVYEAGYVGPAKAVAPGASLSATSHLFAGAKTVPLLKSYQQKLGIPRFEDAVDWGNVWFFTKPIFQLLEFYNKLVGNFGIAILLLTVTVKAVFFPLANKSYESISKMKKVQPQIEAIKKRNEKDPAKLQQETMALYQAEKINPFMGCLPMLIQIPVFYALYKVLSVTIEMRQAPFYGWVHDLSQRDPTTIFNLFGLIPWDPSTAPLIGGFLGGTLHIGVWPLIYGFTMWLTQAMSPPAGVDPMQQRMFQLFPIIFTFTLSQFAVGLVIYWCWNNFLSILQQYVIMRRYKVDNPIDQLLSRFGGAKAPSG